MKNKVREYILNIPLFTYFNLIIMSGVIDTSEEYKIISSIIENIEQSYINESHSLNLFFNVISLTKNIIASVREVQSILIFTSKWPYKLITSLKEKDQLTSSLIQLEKKKS